MIGSPAARAAAAGPTAAAAVSRRARSGRRPGIGSTYRLPERLVGRRRGPDRGGRTRRADWGVRTRTRTWWTKTTCADRLHHSPTSRGRPYPTHSARTLAPLSG